MRSRAIAILGLAVFAAVLKAFLFGLMPIRMRALFIPGVVGLFWPSLGVEIVGAIIIFILLGMHWIQGRQKKPLCGEVS